MRMYKPKEFTAYCTPKGRRAYTDKQYSEYRKYESLKKLPNKIRKGEATRQTKTKAESTKTLSQTRLYQNGSIK